LVFAAILFTNGFHNIHAVTGAVAAFVAMCLLSSAVYVFNDIQDVEKDKSHPRKKLRPIAAGLVSPKMATILGVSVLALSGVIFVLLGKKAIAIALTYIVLQLVYNGLGKAVPVLDVFLLASGFVLRAVLGAAAINVRISAWLLLCTGALALLLGFAKRRNEFIIQGENRTASRASLAGYSQRSLDALVIMAATAAALCYGIYALQSPTAQKYPALFITTIFVFYGICRYVLLVFVEDEGGEPETLLLKDKHMVASVVLFAISAVVAMSGVDFPLVEFARNGVVK
jgi:4-hydroxybenzoate polyprenyltransferase